MKNMMVKRFRIFGLSTDRVFTAASLRIIVPVGLTFIMFVLGVFLYFIPFIEEQLMGQKRLMIQDLTDNAWSLLVQYEAEVRNGDLSLKQAQKRAMNRIRKLRYGPEGKDYFWINDMQPKMVMHPYRTDLEGQDLSDYTDSNGTRPFVEFVRIVKNHSAGYVDYAWQWKDDPGRIAPKISYVRAFKPWGWIVGTGIYVEDVSREIASFSRRVVLVSFVILIVALLFALYIILESVKTERKRMRIDEKLHESEKMFRTLCEEAPFGISITGSDHRFEYLNPKFMALFGYTKRDIPDKETWFKKAYPQKDYREKIRSTWDNDQRDENSGLIVNNNIARVFAVRCKNGEEKIIRFGVVPLEEGKQFLTYQDITEESRMEAALKESEKKFMSLYDESSKALEIYRSFLLSSADAIILYDMDGKAQYVNRAFTDIFGWTEEEVLEERIPFLPESERERAMTVIRDIVTHGTPCHNHISKRLTKDGRLRDVSISASRFETYKGEASGLFVILRDISEKKALETQFYESQKMESVGTLAGGIAHDFNNLLMAIQGNVTMIMLNQGLDDREYERIKNIEQYIQKGADLTKQLLGFARGGKYEVKATDLNALIRNGLSMFTQAKKEITIHMELDKDIWMVAVDQGQIDQVLLNLYVNAAQAMPEGGAIFVHTQNIFLPRDPMKTFDLEPGRYVKVLVADAGVGMDAEIRKRIFDPFFTTRAVGEGTGLGLASAYGIIRNHGGIINVESEAGMWTAVSFFLPAVAADLSGETPVALDERIRKGEETVLLVDDEEMILDIGTEFLEIMGYHVLTAGSGMRALQLYEEKGDEIALVVLDMVMPDMTGGDCFDRLRDVDPTVKVLLSSGYSVDGQASKILDRGCNGFIQKPFKIEHLSKKIRDILDSSETMPTA
jgi:two-component system cell cycle sensor histidine kinase/response regulator CckA